MKKEIKIIDKSINGALDNKEYQRIFENETNSIVNEKFRRKGARRPEAAREL